MKRIRVNEEDTEIRYANWIKLMIDLIKPKNLVFIGGRGTAKSTDILAERTIDVCYDMPRAPFAIVADTYVNLMTNIIPAILLGWEERKGWVEHTAKQEGDFVVDKPPPDDWPKPLIKTFNYKHTISTFLGNKFFLLSLDRPSISAGISVVHHFMDEVKYANEAKTNKLFPTLRGDKRMYGDSNYFMGQTFCTDMPNPGIGENDWILRLEKNMDKEQIMNILQTSMVVNDLQIDLLNARAADMPEKYILNLEKNLARWHARLKKIRHDSTFFYVVSSFANADILSLEYFSNLFNTLDFEEFKTSVLSLKARLEVGARFYGNLTEKHFYADGYNYDYYDQFGLRDNIKQTSAGLKYIQPDQPLDAGFDAGNMMSLVIGQEQWPNFRIIKSMYTLAPAWIRELGDQFIEFFKPHRRKQLFLYYDRSANAYRKAGQDFASKLKEAIERDRNGKATGWSVKLMNIGHGNITHAQEFDLMNELMSETNPRLPRLQIDKFECKELKSSLELAPLERSNGEIKKVKKSEKLPAKRLPFESTNFSDAFKAIICRQRYLIAVRGKKVNNVGNVRVGN